MKVRKSPTVRAWNCDEPGPVKGGGGFYKKSELLTGCEKLAAIEWIKASKDA
jgi:hypothetical protein